MKEEQTTRPWAVAVRMLLVIAVMASFVLASTAQAAQHDTEGRRVIPMGRTVGIKLFSDGVMVVGFSEVSAAGGGHHHAYQQRGSGHHRRGPKRSAAGRR